MSEVAKLEHGDFVWDELTSTDAAKAASFYCGLLGWKTEEMPMGEMGTYTLCMNEGGMIGGIMGMPPMVPEGTPSHWGSYIYVDNAEEAFAKATGASEKIDYRYHPSVVLTNISLCMTKPKPTCA